MKKLIFIFVVLVVSAQAQITLIDDIAPKNDAFDVIVDINRIGAADTDSSMDIDDDGIIDPRRLVNSRYSGMDGWVVYYDWDADSLYLGAGGSGMPAADFNDSLESQIEFSPKTHAKLDTSTAVRGAIDDSLQTNWATFIADNNTQLSEEQVEDFVGGMLGGTETGISVTYQDGTNDIDFVVGVGWPLDVDADSVYLDSTEIVTWLYWTAAYDSVDNWNNLVNDDRDSVLAFTGIVSEAKDSLTNWANKVNDNSDDIDNLETEPRYLFTIYNPNSLWDADSLLIGIDPRTPVAITVTRIDVTCDADPTTELDFDLMWADARIGNANRTVIDEMNTTSGTTVITSGFDDATIPANKCIYIRFNAEPDADILDVNVRVTYTID